MEQKYDKKKGSLLVSENVISSIVANAVAEIKGVSGLAKCKKSFLKALLRDENCGDIRVKFSGDVVELTLGIILKSGSRAVQVAEAIQTRVKEAVQEMTGLTVSRVNILISGIDYPA